MKSLLVVVIAAHLYVGGLNQDRLELQEIDVELKTDHTCNTCIGWMTDDQKNNQ